MLSEQCFMALIGAPYETIRDAFYLALRVEGASFVTLTECCGHLQIEEAQNDYDHPTWALDSKRVAIVPIPESK